MSNKIVNILLAMPLLLLSGCSSDDDGTRQDGVSVNGENRKIRFTASVSSPVFNDGGITRAWADTYNDRLPSGAPVYVYLYAYNGSGSAIDVINYMFKNKKGEDYTGAFVYQTSSEVDVASGRSPLVQISPTAADMGVTDAEDVQPVFPASLTSEDAYVDAVAIFLPEGGGSNGSGELHVGGGTFTFTAPADQTTETAVVSADLLTNEVSSTMKSSTSAINLDMRHRMCKVLVQFNPTEGLTQDNMPNNTYLMENVQTRLTMSLPEGTVTTTGPRGTVTALAGQPFFIAPQTIMAGTELLKFDLRNVGGTETGIKNVTLKPTTDLEFRGGVFYVLTVDVGVRYINMTTTIKDWTGETVVFDKVIL